MNRLAVVLAADSATTVTQVTEDGEQERYFKGANKIFQLSDYEPVGLMIFDSADILSVPWEVVIKCFRKQLGTKSFNDLKGYAQEFFSYLSTNLNLFPEAVQRRQLVSAARRVVLRTLIVTDGALGPEDRSAEVTKQINALRDTVQGGTFPPDVAPEFVSDCVAKVKSDVEADIEPFRPHLGDMPADLSELAELGIRRVLLAPGDHFGTTGLVFAGYGDHDVFPAMLEYLSSGVLLGRHVAAEVSDMAIDHTRPAWIRAFAQTSMSDTFTLGLSGDIYSSVMVAVRSGLNDLVSKVIEEAGLDPSALPNRDALVKAAGDGISTAMLNEARDEHATPMRRVLAVLPVEEMAELAETLINLQSLKEKVTRPSETVGGPVDVAVITRNEGLVWIKRKHYFDAGLNSRFLQRQALAHKA